jgi:hypothetical protein
MCRPAAALIAGRDFERSVWPADEDFALEQRADRFSRGHVTDAGLFGDFAFAGNRREDVIAFADSPFDDRHHMLKLRPSRHARLSFW